ncbi:MAG: AbrB/MazE/SpoVT family DNA-binding domain-containing protein [Candidatus Cloacimonetes bacterium]|nr:AbrB/MazE/SpoVT family DNA-binding domain-containing protein [Candidatus Cloacimonadota bacterium]
MQSVIINKDKQITLPAELMEDMGLEVGSELIFSKKNGEYVLVSLVISVLKEMKEIMKGEAEKVGWYDDDDVADYIMELRKTQS